MQAIQQKVIRAWLSITIIPLILIFECINTFSFSNWKKTAEKLIEKRAALNEIEWLYISDMHDTK